MARERSRKMGLFNFYAILAIFLSVTNAFPSTSDFSWTTDALENYRLPKTSVPKHYHIKLIPHIVEGNFTFAGECIVDCMILSPTADIVLHSKNLDIDESFTRLKRTEDVTNIVPMQHAYNEMTEMLIVHFNEILHPGTYTLHLKYTGILDSILYGFYRSSYLTNDGNVVWLAATHFQPTSARLAFPCWDEPALKATFDVSIKHNSNYTALSNMPVREHSEVDSDGKIWTHFQTTPVMSTNILAFVVADFDYVSNGEGTIKIWCRRDVISRARYLLDVAEKATVVLEEYMNSTVRVPKMDHALIPTYSSRATENWGLITYREDIFMDDKNLYLSTSKENAILTGVHELVHMWFGNIVSPAWWKYLWMSEGFATYMKYYIGNKIYKDWRLNDLMVVQDVQRMLNFDSGPMSHPLNMNVNTPRDIRRIYSPITYSKTGCLLRMLLHCVSEDVFRTGLIKYVERHQYNAVTPDDLWAAIQYAVNKSNIAEPKFDVKTVMDTWIEQRGYPIVNVTRDYVTGEIQVTQKWYYSEETLSGITENSVKWWIPLNFATQSNPDFSSTLPMMWMQPEDTVKSINDTNINDWIILNIQQTGFYRVHYDTVNWRRIAKYLNSHDYTKIHVTNRAQLIDDAYELHLRNEISRVLFLEIINYLQREADYIPWYTAYNILNSNRRYLSSPRYSAVLKSHILHLMNHAIETVGFEERPGDNYLSRRHRLAIMEWACMVGHTECRSNATAKLASHLTDPIANKLTYDVKHWAFRMGLRNANESIWSNVLTIYENAPSIDILHYLGCSEDPVIIERYLNLILAEDSPILKTHSLEAIRSIYWENPINLKIVINFLIDNIAKVSARIDDIHVIFNELYNYPIALTPEQEEKMRTFTAYSTITPSTANQEEETLAGIEEDIAHARESVENDDSDNSAEMSSIDNNSIDNPISK